MVLSLSAKTFPRLSVIRAPQADEGMRKVTRQPDGQPIEARPGFFLYKMGQNSLTRIGSDYHEDRKHGNLKFQHTVKSAS